MVNKKVVSVNILTMFIMAVVAHNASWGQCVIESRPNVVYGYDFQETNYTEYIIKNHTQDTVYAWIDTCSIALDSLTLEQRDVWFFLKYLRAPPCEIGLDMLCHDHSINIREMPPPPIIGCTFIKKVYPNESFVIISLNNGIKKDSIHYVRKEIVCRLLKTAYLDVFCYDRPYIVVR